MRQLVQSLAWSSACSGCIAGMVAGAVAGAVGSAVASVVAGAVAGAAGGAVAGVVAGAVADAIGGAVAGAAGGTVAGAVDDAVSSNVYAVAAAVVFTTYRSLILVPEFEIPPGDDIVNAPRPNVERAPVWSSWLMERRETRNVGMYVASGFEPDTLRPCRTACGRGRGCRLKTLAVLVVSGASAFGWSMERDPHKRDLGQQSLSLWCLCSASFGGHCSPGGGGLCWFACVWDIRPRGAWAGAVKACLHRISGLLLELPPRCQ